MSIFSGDAFSVTTLTDAIQDKTFRPGRLDELGLFTATSVSTLTIALERIGDTIKLVEPTPRGGPGETRDYPKRTVEQLFIPHFQRDWAVYADEVQDVRAFGSERALQTVQAKVAEKIGLNIADLDVTEEYARLGAIQGVVRYKGGRELNLFDVFGVAPAAEVNLDLRNLDPIDGALRRACTGIIRATRKAAGPGPLDHVHAFVGDDLFDDLLQHREVRDTYRGWGEAKLLRESYVGASRGSNPIFEFGGIVWENYGAMEESGDGALLGIERDRAKFFPVGMPGLFRTYYAPADYNETVNTMGKRLYAKSWPMPNDKGIQGETQSNALSICTRPACLLSAVAHIEPVEEPEPEVPPVPEVPF